MDADETQVCTYLKCFPDQFVSAREICRRADGKWRYREDERWALPVLQRLLEEKAIETDEAGHYRLLSKEEPKSEEKEKQWISPEAGEPLERRLSNIGIVDVGRKLDAAEHS